ncbi:hypothetical protein GCM10020331_072400 [Ectobacillus funiculus]
MDIDAMYEELVANPKNQEEKKLDLSARDMLIKVSMIQLESGYPYIMFKSNANEQHPLKDIGSIKNVEPLFGNFPTPRNIRN